MPRLMPTDTGEELWALGTPVSEPAVSLLSVQGQRLPQTLMFLAANTTLTNGLGKEWSGSCILGIDV